MTIRAGARLASHPPSPVVGRRDSSVVAPAALCTHTLGCLCCPSRCRCSPYSVSFSAPVSGTSIDAGHFTLFDQAHVGRTHLTTAEREAKAVR
jgi:hypothetical protein